MSSANNESKKGLLILATILLMITSLGASYSSNVILPSVLTQMEAMDYYAVYAAIASMGMMIALPLSGSLNAKFGARNVLVFAVIAQFVLRFLFGAISNIILFGVVYALAGFMGGLYMAAPYSIMASIVTPQERPKYFGYLAAASAAGALIGPLLAGFVVDNISLNMAWICYGIFAVIPVIVFLTSYPNTKREGVSLDGLGLLLLVVFVFCMIMWLSLGGKLFAFASAIGIILPIVAIVTLVVLIKYETKQANPAVPVGMFAKKRFRTTFIIQCLVVSYATCIGAYGIVYAQQVMGFDATVSSTVTMPQTIVQFILGLFLGSFVGKAFKQRFRFFGLLAIVSYMVGLAIFYMLTPNTALFVVYLATGIGGIGQTITQSCYAAFFQTELKPEEIPSAQGMYQFASTGGSCIFTAICGAAMNMGLSLNQVFLVGALFAAVAFVIGIFGFRFPKEEIEAEKSRSVS